MYSICCSSLIYLGINWKEKKVMLIYRGLGVLGWEFLAQWGRFFFKLSCSHLKRGRKSKVRPNMVKQNVVKGYLGITESESGLYFGRELTTWKNVDIRIKRWAIIPISEHEVLSALRCNVKNFHSKPTMGKRTRSHIFST